MRRVVVVIVVSSVHEVSLKLVFVIHSWDSEQTGTISPFFQVSSVMSLFVFACHRTSLFSSFTCLEKDVSKIRYFSGCCFCQVNWILCTWRDEMVIVAP